MKKVFFMAATVAAFASCSTESLVDDWFGGSGKEGPISFNMTQKNMVRSTQDMHKVGHYNFGVFAYKSTETVNEIMANYLVGYYGEADKLGYYMTTGNQTTLGDKDGLADGESYWQYEKLGNAEYNYAGEGFYRAEQTEFMSNVDKQYLRYWDLSAPTTSFYAYAPYINSATDPVTYVDGTAQAATGADKYVMTFPNGSIKTAKNDPALNEYMYAYTEVAKANYGHDVALNFKRLNAKVNIKFWEDIPGYSVRILDLKEGTYEGVQATPAIHKDNDHTTGSYGPYGYRLGQYYLSNGAKIQFPGETIKQFEGTLSTDAGVAEPLVFAAPTASAIGETRFEASASDDTYYVVPKGDGANVLADGNANFTVDQACEADLAKTGFTFHVSYELTSTTGERITVKDATVFVPADYCNWKANTHYTYIFKITNNSNGSTDPDQDGTIDPTKDPEVPTEIGLYPIIFDNCTITDYETEESEWEITEGTGLDYYNVVLSQYSIKSGDITVTIDEKHADAGHTANGLDKVTVTPTGKGVTYDGAGKITVAPTAAPGVYTVTYTCHDSGNFNHPKTWTETFVVGHEYKINTNLDKVGANGNEAKTKLLISTDTDAAGFVEATSADGFSIEYPKNITDDNKVKVEVEGGKAYVTVAKDAKPGNYKLVYKVDTNGDATRDAKGDEKVFSVVDYGFSLSRDVAYLGATPVVINLTDPADAEGEFSMTAPAGVTLDAAGNKVTVTNDAAEATSVDVVYTVNKGTVSQVTYTKSFAIRNSHAVALSATSMDRSTGTSAAGDYSTDAKNITTTQNGKATTTDLTSSLSIVKADGTATAAGDFKITYTSGNTYKLEVKNTVDAGNYRVKFVSTVAGADKAEYFDFVVTE